MYAGLRHIFRNLTILYVPKWQTTFDTLYDFSYNHTFSVTNNALNISQNGFYATSSFYFVTPTYNRNDDFRYNGYTFLIDRDFVKNKNTNPSFLFLNSTTSTTYNLSDVRYLTTGYQFRVQNNNITIDEDRLTNDWWSISYDFKGVVKLNTIHTYAITSSNASTFYQFARFRFINRTQSNYNTIRSLAFFKECLSEEQTLEFEQFIENQKDSKLYNDMPLFVSTYIPEIINENISYNNEIVEVAPRDKGKMCSYAVKNQTLTYGGESLSTEQLPYNISLRIFNEYFTGNKISITYDSTLNDIVKLQFQYVLSKFRLSQNPKLLFPHLDFLICPAMLGIVDSDLDTKSNVHYTNARSCINGYDVIKNLIEDSDKEFTYYYQTTYAQYLHAGKRLLHLDVFQNITYDVEGLTIDDALWNTYPYTGFGCTNYTPGWSYCVSVLVYRTSYKYDSSHYLSGFELQQNMLAWAYTVQHCIFGLRYDNGLSFNRDGGSIGYQSYNIGQTETYEGWWVITFNIDGSTDGSKWGRSKIFSAQISAPEGVVARGVSNNQWVDARTAYAFSNWAEQINIVFRMIRPQSGALKMMAIQNTTLSDDEFSEFNHYMIDYALTCPEINGNQLFRGKLMVVADSSLLSFI